MSVMKAATGAAVAATLMFPVLVPGGYWWGVGGLALLGGLAALGRLWPGWLNPRPLGRRGWRLVWVLLGVVSTMAAMAWLHEELLGALPRLGAMLLALLGLVALHTWRPRLSALWAGLAMGGMLAGGWALWQRLQEGAGRASGHDPLHAILFGNVSLLTGGLCLAGVVWALARPRHTGWLLVLAAGAIGGLLASVLSGTRGGWVALPLILLLFHRGFLAWLPGWQQALAWLSVVTLAIGLYAVPQTGVQHRVGLAMDELSHYLEGESAPTASVTARLEMWRGAWQLIQQRPLLGHGSEGYRQGMAELVEGAVVAPSVLPHGHAHNDLLDAWAKFGLPGLMALLALYLLPVLLFRSGLRHADTTHRTLAVAGLLLPVAFIDFGLTYSFFAYPVGGAVYSAWLVVLWTLYRHAPLVPEVDQAAKCQGSVMPSG